MAGSNPSGSVTAFFYAQIGTTLPKHRNVIVGVFGETVLIVVQHLSATIGIAPPGLGQPPPGGFRNVIYGSFAVAGVARRRQTSIFPVRTAAFW